MSGEDVKTVLEPILARGRIAARSGNVADYIPALAKRDPGEVGLAVTLASGETVGSGDYKKKFSIQSISKILSLMYVIGEKGEDAVFSRVGKEPTGDPFNSIIRLETSTRRKPFNPLINAGAIVVSSLLPGNSPREKIEALLAFTGKIAGRADVAFSEPVFVSERDTANRNRAIAWFLKELGLITGDVEETLETYFMQCAIELDAGELSRIGALLAFDGVVPGTDGRLISPEAARIVKSLMMTCGMYDGSGEFGVDAGMPAKSGVGGGIVAGVRGKAGIGTYGPALDDRGNSAAGIEMLKGLSSALDWYVL